MSAKKPATLKDIAQLAGVNVSAVSGVLNGARTGARVSEATRQHIIEIANTLHYQPNALARSLENRQTRMFGVALGWTADLLLHSYIATLLQGIVDGATEANYEPVLFTTSWVEAEANPGIFADRRTDGLIVIGAPEESQIISEVRSYGVPVVGFGIRPSKCPGGSVALDEYDAFRQAVSHLQSLGHRRIAYVTGTMDSYTFHERLELASQVMADLHVPDPSVHVLPLPWPVSPQSTDLLEYLKSPNRPTAIFAFNDSVALALMEAAGELGIAIPEHLSIVGFDDIVEASQSTPALTTLYQPIREIGKTIVRRLIEIIPLDPDEVETQPPILIKTELIVRQSTGPAPVLM